MAENNKKYVELVWHQKYDKLDRGEKLPVEKPNLPYKNLSKELDKSRLWHNVKWL